MGAPAIPRSIASWPTWVSASAIGLNQLSPVVDSTASASNA
jgi:hypothetical protein